MLTHWEEARARGSQPGIAKMDQEAGNRSSLPIGGLTKRIVNTLSAAGTTTYGSRARRKDFETIASETNRVTRTGTPHGVVGFAPPSVSLPAIVARTELRDRLHRNPAQFFPPSLRSAIAETWEGNNTGYGWDGFVSRYELTRPIGEDERNEALAFVAEALEPASEDFILGELGRLRAMTVGRDIGQDLALVFAVYTDELKHYPADAIREVLREWPNANKFWPSMAELSAPLRRIVEPRIALRAALERGYREPEYSPDWIPPPTEEQKREVMELLAKHGIALDERGRLRPLEREPISLADLERAERALPEIRDMWIKRLLAGDTSAAGAA